MTRIARTLVALAASLVPATASADPDDAPSLSWQLQPVTVEDSVRIASTAAAFEDRNGNLDLVVATTWTGSYQLSSTWAPLLRLGFVGNDAPGAALDGTSFANPLVGVIHARAAGRYRLAYTVGVTLPLGTGNATTHAAAAIARPADRAMFDVDHPAAVAGIDVAYVHRGLTAQAEASLAVDAEQPHASVGLHVGHVVGWGIAVAGDLHYEETLTTAVGLRAQLRLGELWIRPGLAYVTDRAVMLDVPVTF